MKIENRAVRFLVIFTVLTVTLVFAQNCCAANGVAKTDSAYDRMTDWFATLGKTPKEKYLIKNERRAARKIQRAKRKIAKQKRMIAKQKER